MKSSEDDKAGHLRALVPGTRLRLDTPGAAEAIEAGYPKGTLDETSSRDSRSSTYVAILDVLGFRHICETSSPHVIRDRLRAIEDRLVSARDRIERRSRESGLPYANVRWLFFSDTLLLYSDTASPLSLQLMCETMAYSIAIGLENGLPLRGALVKGELMVDRRPESPLPAFLGKALVRAHDLERSQKWAGAIVDVPSVIVSDIDQAMIDHLLVGGVLCTHDVPEGEPVRGVRRLCVDWPTYMYSVRDDRTVRVGQRALLGIPEVGRAHYGDATLAFFRARRDLTAPDESAQRARLRCIGWTGHDLLPRAPPPSDFVRRTLDRI